MTTFGDSMTMRSILKTSAVCFSLMIAATAAEAMPASSSLDVAPAIRAGGAQIEQAALVVVRRRPVRRFVVRRPLRRRVIIR